MLIKRVLSIIPLTVLIILSSSLIQCSQEKNISEDIKSRKSIAKDITTKESNIKLPLIPAAVSRAWKDAVVERDIDTLVEFADGGYWAAVGSKLRDNSSLLYQYILGGDESPGNSYYKFFNSRKNLRIGIVHTKYGFTAYYYEAKAEKEVNAVIHEADNGVQISRLMEKGVLTYQTFYKSADKWCANYELEW